MRAAARVREAAPPNHAPKECEQAKAGRAGDGASSRLRSELGEDRCPPRNAFAVEASVQLVEKVAGSRSALALNQLKPRPKIGVVEGDGPEQS